MDAAERAALQLSVDERLRLIERIWDSVVDAHGDDLPISDAVRAELDRRLAAHRRNPNEALTWEELQRRLREG